MIHSSFVDIVSLAGKVAVERHFHVSKSNGVLEESLVQVWKWSQVRALLLTVWPE